MALGTTAVAQGRLDAASARLLAGAHGSTLQLRCVSGFLQCSEVVVERLGLLPACFASLAPGRRHRRRRSPLPCRSRSRKGGQGVIALVTNMSNKSIRGCGRANFRVFFTLASAVGFVSKKCVPWVAVVRLDAARPVASHDAGCAAAPTFSFPRNITSFPASPASLHFNWSIWGRGSANLKVSSHTFGNAIGPRAASSFLTSIGLMGMPGVTALSAGAAETHASIDAGGAAPSTSTPRHIATTPAVLRLLHRLAAACLACHVRRAGASARGRGLQRTPQRGGEVSAAVHGRHEHVGQPGNMSRFLALTALATLQGVLLLVLRQAPPRARAQAALPLRSHLDAGARQGPPGRPRGARAEPEPKRLP